MSLDFYQPDHRLRITAVSCILDIRLLKHMNPRYMYNVWLRYSIPQVSKANIFSLAAFTIFLCPFLERCYETWWIHQLKFKIFLLSFEFKSPKRYHCTLWEKLEKLDFWDDQMLWYQSFAPYLYTFDIMNNILYREHGVSIQKFSSNWELRTKYLKQLSIFTPIISNRKTH